MGARRELDAACFEDIGEVDAKTEGYLDERVEGGWGGSRTRQDERMGEGEIEPSDEDESEWEIQDKSERERGTKLYLPSSCAELGKLVQGPESCPTTPETIWWPVPCFVASRPWRSGGNNKEPRLCGCLTLPTSTRLGGQGRLQTVTSQEAATEIPAPPQRPAWRAWPKAKFAATGRQAGSSQRSK